MSTLSKYTQMVKNLFPTCAEIEGNVEERENEDTYGFVVTVSRDRQEPICIKPEQLMEIKRAMNASFFGVYPTEPIRPYDIRMYFHIVVSKDEA